MINELGDVHLRSISPFYSLLYYYTITCEVGFCFDTPEFYPRFKSVHIITYLG